MKEGDPTETEQLYAVASEEFEGGSPDPCGVGCQLIEFPPGGEGTDHSKGYRVRMTGHTGSHTEGGKGHIDHWEGYEKQTGIWEYPLESFYGEAVVCDLSSVKPLSEKGTGEQPRRGSLSPLSTWEMSGKVILS